MLNDYEKRQDILDHISVSDYIKGKNYYMQYIEFLGKTKIGNLNKYEFKVESERTIDKYKCKIETTKLGNINSLSCTCKGYQQTRSCKHLGACLANYTDTIFEIDEDYRALALTDKIFSLFTKEKSTTPKEEVTLELELFSTYSNYDEKFIIEVKPKIGIKKLYQLKSPKLSLLYDAINYNGRTVTFGKEFIFNPKTNYFKQKNLDIIEFLINKERHEKNNSYYYNRNSNFEYSDQEAKDLLNLLKNTNYKLNNMKILNTEKGNPLPMNLTEVENNYQLEFDNKNINILTTDFKYIQKDNTIYIVKDNQATFMKTLFTNSLDKLIFSKDKVEAFSKSVLPIIKNELTIDDNITDIVIAKTPTAKLYFDLYYNKIICSIKFTYNENELDFFDKTTNILRDEEYEQTVLDELFSNNFNIENNTILISDSDDIGYFLEEGLINLSEKYETFTSKKLKDVNIIKKSNISSTFSIGQDNIMSYSFDFDNVNNEEIEDVLKALRQKKKYFHLKSGDLINLEENDNLKELENLAKEMELKDSDLRNAEGEIPKYRAIYLDSLKENKYKNVIKTTNLFNDLINKFKSFKDSEITLSKEELAILRGYQVTGIKWLYNIHKTGFGGILADEMGLGKSIQTIFFIKELLKEDKSSKFLIVAPTSLAYNWEREFDKFGSELNYKVIVGLRDKRRLDLEDTTNTNILITTYGLLREDKEYYEKIHFTSMIIDEAQNIKNPTTEITKTVKSIKAESMIALTGTPIENSVIELWSIFDFIMPGFLASLIKFKSKYKVKDFDDDTNNLLASLNKQIAPFILRRKKKDVMKELPEKIENNIFIDLSPSQKKLYIAELNRVNKEIEKTMAEGGMNKVRFMILQLLTKLRQLCIDPRIIFENYKDGSEKMDTLIRVIKEVTDNGHKILLFTSFKTALELVKKELDKNNLTSYTIDGSVSSKKRMELVDQFNSDDTNVFLIMLKAGGTGLNLTSSDVVIHLDLWWNPQAENQATDRAHRIGQKNKVEVIKLITKGTIEEKILNLQEKKKILSDKLIESNERDTNLLANLNEKDLKNLLAFENKDE